MPITVFLNNKGSLEKQSNFFLDDKTKEGWWNTLIATDLNNDGKLDIVVGNEGINNVFNATTTSPIEIHFDDFDQNGSIDPLISYYIQGKPYPLATRDELLAQLVKLKSTYPSYQSYAETDMDQLLKELQTTQTQKWKASQLESLVLLTSEEGYHVKTLPDIAQWSPLKSIIPLDLDSDGNQDLLLFGNRSKNALKIGQNDANFGTLLFGNGDGTFRESKAAKTGLRVQGDVSAVVAIDSLLYIGKSDEALSIYKRNSDEN